MEGPTKHEPDHKGWGKRTVSSTGILMFGAIVAVAAIMVPLIIRFAGL